MDVQNQPQGFGVAQHSPVSGDDPDQPVAISDQQPGGVLSQNAYEEPLENDVSVYDAAGGGGAPELEEPRVLMSPEEWLLVLQDLDSESRKSLLIAMKETITNQIAELKIKLDKKIKEMRDAWAKMDEAARRAKMMKCINWAIKGLTVIALTAAIAVTAPFSGGVSAGVLGVIMVATLAGTTLDVVKQASGDDDFSWQAELQNSGMGKTGGAVLGGALVGDLAMVSGAIASECTDDSDAILAITVLATILQTAIMLRQAFASAAKATDSPEKAAKIVMSNMEKLAVITQVGSQFASGGLSIAQGGLQIEHAKIKKEVDYILAQIKDLNELLRFIDRILQEGYDMVAALEKMMLDNVEGLYKIIKEIGQGMQLLADNRSNQYS